MVVDVRTESQEAVRREARAHAIRLALLSDPQIITGILEGYDDELAGRTISMEELARRYELD